MNSLKKTALLFTLSLLVSACLYERREVAPLPDLTGQWRGAVQDSVSGGGTLVLDLERVYNENEYDELGGSWSLSFGSSRQEGDVAYVGGAERGLIMGLGTASSCAYDLEASVTERTLIGTYLTRDCEPYALGTLELERQ